MNKVNVKFVKDFYFHSGTQYLKIHSGSVIEVHDCGDKWTHHMKKIPPQCIASEIEIPSHYAMITSEYISENISNMNQEDIYRLSTYISVLKSAKASGINGLCIRFKGNSLIHRRFKEGFVFDFRTSTNLDISLTLSFLKDGNESSPLFLSIGKNEFLPIKTMDFEEIISISDDGTKIVDLLIIHLSD